MPETQSPTSSASPSWFSTRVLIVVAINLLAYVVGRSYLEYYLHLNLSFINQLPFATFFIITGIACIWNPIASRLFSRGVLSTPELLSSLVLSLAMVWGSGISISHLMIGPRQLSNGELAWEKYQLIEHMPDQLYPLAGDKTHPDYANVYVDYAQGLSPGESIPWQHWMDPLLHWWPLLAIFATIITCLSWMLHRQWSHHEQLNYPISQIAHNLFARNQKRLLPDIFYSPLMWIAAGTTLFFHLYGMINTWFPEALPGLSFKGRFNFLWAFFPILNRTGSFWLVDFHLMFSVIGLAYFLGREVGITLALSQVLLLIFSIQFYLNTGSVVNGGNIEMSRAGAYLAYGAIILITGRHYYWALLRKAFGRNPEIAQQESAWVVRLFLFANLLLLLYLTTVFQLDFLLAALLILVLLMVAMVFSRLVCEIGGPYIQGQWSIGNLLINTLGPSAIGPAGLVGLLFVCQALSVSGNNALMPYLSNGLQIADKAKIKSKRIFGAVLICVLLSITGGTIYKIKYFYEHGAQSKHGNAAGFSAVKGSLDTAQRAVEKLDEFNQIQISTETSGLSKLSLIAPEWSNLKWVLFGAFGVILFFVMRVRCTWFPLHPILFLVWDTFPIQIFYWSFFFGWFCKELVIRFGGGSIYQKAKPFFIGLIVGDILAFGITASTSIIYFLATGVDPKVYRVFIFF